MRATVIDQGIYKSTSDLLMALHTDRHLYEAVV